MRSSKKSIKKSKPGFFIDVLWNADASREHLKLFKDRFRKNRDVARDIYNDDPAALLFLYGSEVKRALDVSDISPVLPLPEYDAALKRQTASRLEDPRCRPVTTLISFFATNRKLVMPIAAILILLGAIFIYRSLTLRQESAPDSTQGISTAEGLKKNQIYDKDIRRETAANAHVRTESEFIAARDRKDANAYRNAITTNLVAEGSKVIHYRMDSGTEMIFVTGLD